MNKKFLSIFIAIMSLSLIAIVGCNQKTKYQISQVNHQDEDNNQDGIETNKQALQISQNNNQDEDGNQDGIETNEQALQVSQNNNQDEDNNQDSVETNKYQS